MNIKFDKKVVSQPDIKPEPIKKRRWDRWIYLAILIFLVLSFIKWLATPWFFNFAHGVLLQQQYDVQFANDIRILKYNVKEDQQVKAGDTLFLYERFGGERTPYGQDSLKMELKNREDGYSLIALNSQIEKRRLFLIDLEKRLKYWKAERLQKEKLVYLNVVTSNELANVDRSIDDVEYQIATLKAEYEVLLNEQEQMKFGLQGSNDLNLKSLNAAHQKTAFTAPVGGRVDRLRIPVQQICYRQDKVMSIIHPEYYVRAYIDVEDLDEFKVGDHVVVVLPYGYENLQGTVQKIHAVSELREEVVSENTLSDQKHGIVVHIVPAAKEGWDKLTVSNIPVKIRKGRINL